jgi:undecaprenyl-diphosphatase
MNFIHAIILSVIEGLTEFLPISSTGHMVLASKILDIEQTDFVKSFEIIIQLGAIFAVVFLYWSTISRNINVWKKVITAFIPTGIIGFLLYKIVKNVLLGNLTITVYALLIGGILLILLEKIYKEKDYYADSIEKISYKNAFMIGLFQSVSIIPGVSRSAATIIPALLLGTKRKTAVEFSFLLAIPTMLAATSLDLVKSSFSFTLPEYLILIVGLVVSFVVALIAVRFLLDFIKKHTFIPFGIYRIVLAIVFWLTVLR